MLKIIVFIIISIVVSSYMFDVKEIFRGKDAKHEKSCEKAMMYTQKIIMNKRFQEGNLQDRKGFQDMMDRLKEESYDKLDKCTENYNQKWIDCILASEDMDEIDDCGSFTDL